jgi:hypothetical protein
MLVILYYVLQYIQNVCKYSRYRVVMPDISEADLSFLHASTICCLVHSSTLETQAICFSETSGSLRATQRDNPKTVGTSNTTTH